VNVKLQVSQIESRFGGVPIAKERSARELKKKVAAAVITLVLLLSFTAVPVFAGTINVPPGSIQTAINAAISGDTINVTDDGPYDEDLTIGKSLTIQGTGATVINGNHTITASDVTLDGFVLSPDDYGIAVTIDSSAAAISGINITDCIFELDSGEVGIWIGGLSPTYPVSDVEISNNTFNGPDDQISNPWKIGGWFGNSIGCEVSDVDFVNNTVDSGSIPINLDDENIDDVLIEGNIFTNTDGVVYVWGEGDPIGGLSNFVFTRNNVDSTNSYGVGIDPLGDVFDDDNFGDGNRVNYNNFIGIVGKYGFGAVSILADLDGYWLDAQKNWWGHASGPSGDDGRVNKKGKIIGKGSPVHGQVDWDPWLPQPCWQTKHDPVPPGLKLK